MMGVINMPYEVIRLGSGDSEICITFTSLIESVRDYSDSEAQAAVLLGMIDAGQMPAWYGGVYVRSVN